MALSRIRATVTVSAPVASVTVSASGAIGTTAGVTQAAITQVIPIAAIQWVTIVYEAAVDYRGLNPVLREINIVVDAAALGVGKGFVESHTAVDQLQPFVINKGIEENPSFTEIVVYEYSKSLADSVDATDDLFGQANLDDEQVMFLVKGAILENVSTADSDNIEFGKNNEEQLSAVDSDPDFDVTKGLDDQLNTSEVLGFDYQKPLTESLDAGDEINGSVQSDDGQTFFMQTNRSDAATVSDQEVQEFGKNTSDSLTTADSLGAFVLGKGITDTPQTSEETSYAYTKPVAGDEADASDAPAITFAPAAKAEIVRAQREGPSLIENYAAVGYFAEQYVGNGGPKRDIGKGVAEAAQTTDDVSVATAFARTFTDAVDATDDFDGEATAEDDQTAAVIKLRSDIAHATESLSFSGSFVRSDSIGASDVLSHLTGKTLQDSWTVSDAQTVSAGKGLTDTSSTSEFQTFNIAKALADTANVTDDFDGAASVEDDQVMQFVTSRSETATASESASLLAGKGLADSASTGDSGSLRMQGYCDDSYFAEIYLGTSITF